MNKKLILYNLDLSPPVRAVKVTAKLLGLDLDLRNINILNGETYTDEYLKLNPEHTVPTLVDGDFSIWDSHTICAYLVDKYGKDDKLYPKDLKLRAKCNQRLFFDAASLFVRMREFSLHFILRGGTDIPQSMVDPIYVAYEILERFLANDPFLVGTHLTIADISVATTVSALQIYAPLKSDEHPKILAWLKRVKETIPFFEEINGQPIEAVRTFIHKLMQKNKLKSKL